MSTSSIQNAVVAFFKALNSGIKGELAIEHAAKMCNVSTKDLKTELFDKWLEEVQGDE